MKRISPWRLAGFSALGIACLILIGPLAYGIVRGAGELPSAIYDEEVQFACGLSLLTALISTGICMPLSLCATSALFSGRFRGRGAIIQLITTPMALPHIVLGIMLVLFFGNQGLAPFLEPLGIEFIFTVQGIILAQVVTNIPFVVEQLWAAFSNINPKQLFQARSMGASSAQLDWLVVFPSVKRDIIAAVIMCFSRCLGEYGAVMMVAGTTRMGTEVLPTAILLNTSTGNLSRALSIATILILLAVALSSLSRMWLRQSTREGRLQGGRGVRVSSGNGSTGRGNAGSGSGNASGHSGNENASGNADDERTSSGNVSSGNVNGNVSGNGNVNVPECVAPRQSRVPECVAPRQNSVPECVAPLQCDEDANVPILTLDALEVYVGACHTAPLSLKLSAGQHICLTGSSGIGKTLILETIAGRWKAHAGHMLLRGVPLQNISPAQRRIGLLYQDSMLYNHFSVLDNVALPLRLKYSARRAPLHLARRHAREMLAWLNLEHLAQRNPATLSGGEAQRVALARTLIHNPQLLLLDEPFAALDAATKHQMEDKLAAWQQQHTASIIEVTHDKQRALRLCSYDVKKFE